MWSVKLIHEESKLVFPRVELGSCWPKDTEFQLKETNSRYLCVIVTTVNNNVL
jgi:hypothetical protein